MVYDAYLFLKVRVRKRTGNTRIVELVIFRCESEDRMFQISKQQEGVFNEKGEMKVYSRDQKD